jgi:adenine-specific DNA-methyltransferase
MAEQDFIKAGFSVVGTETNDNKLLSFLRENYPNVIKDNEINLNELKAIAGLPIDEKVNGYGLNFVGRNFSRAKYAQKTEKEVLLNNKLSKNIDTTQNLVLKGDNLDSLKILKNHYSGKIKCIYIDPPYNTTKDEFVYPDNFKREELEVIGLANLSNEDIARMEFVLDNPQNKKSHNGWLAFMYPRLLLARDLLSKDGVIFISIDDNEQANLKLLCDDVFGEENMVSQFIWTGKSGSEDDSHIRNNKEYLLSYAKNIGDFEVGLDDKKEEKFNLFDEQKNDYYKRQLLRKWGDNSRKEDRPNLYYPITDDEGNDFYPTLPNGDDGCWRWSKETMQNAIDENRVEFSSNGRKEAYEKIYQSEERGNTKKYQSILQDAGSSSDGTKEVKSFFNDIKIFSNPKPTKLLKQILLIANSCENDIILDFFAGSGTTGHAVMELNKDGGNRKFILCQIDEPIKEDKPAYKFCIDNNLPPVISSITIERLKRAGEKIAKDIEAVNSKAGGLFDEDKKQIPDVGFKVFDSVEAPKLKVDETGQISFTENETDALSRIYNMIFTVGLDAPTQVPEEVVKDSIYKIGNHYYITNSEKVSRDVLQNVFKETHQNGKVFIDGWTASLNGTLQNYKEDVKIVF